MFRPDFTPENEPRHPVFDDLYFARGEGPAESRAVFLTGNGLPVTWRGKDRVRIYETGFGTGLNFLVTWLAWLEDWRQFRETGGKASPPPWLHFCSVEKYPLPREDLKRVAKNWAELEAALVRNWKALSGDSEPTPEGEQRAIRDWLFRGFPTDRPGWHHGLWSLSTREEKMGVSLAVYQGDVADWLAQLEVPADFWYLDGFAPAKNPDMWAPGILSAVGRLARPGTRFSTFTAAGFVRRGLEAAGFRVDKVPGFGRKRERLRGVRISESGSPPGAEGGQKGELHLPFPGVRISEPRPNRDQPITIIGAGIAGCSLAFSLARRGFQNIRLIDKNPEPAGAWSASGNPRGVTYPSLTRQPTPLSALTWQGLDYLRQLVNFLGERFPIEHDWSGLTQFYQGPREIDRLDKARQSQGLPPDYLEVGTVQEGSAWPTPQSSGHLAPETIYARFPRAGWLSPRDLCHALVAASGGAVRFEGNQTIGELHLQYPGWTFLAASQGCRRFPEAAWLPLRKLRGEVYDLELDADRPELLDLLRKSVWCHHHYLVPAAGGENRFWLGSYNNREDLAPQSSLAGPDALLLEWQKIFPGLRRRGKPLASRSAVRSQGVDHLPLAGPLPRGPETTEIWPHTWVLAGLGGRGMLTGPLLAELLVAEICGEPVPFDPGTWQAFSPLRFPRRARKKKGQF